MRSPKFIFSEPSIEGCTSPTHIVSAWKKKVKPQLRKQVLWDLIEFRDIDHDISMLSHQMSKDISEAAYQVSKPKTYLLEKS